MRHLLPLLTFAALAACSPPQEAKTEAPAATETTAPAAGEVATVDLQTNARLTSPATVTGVAPKNWYFEAVFPAMLVGADGRVIAEAPGQAQSDWTAPNNDPIRFEAKFTFQVTHDTPATLVLQPDAPGEDQPPPPEVRIPVVLAAY